MLKKKSEFRVLKERHPDRLRGWTGVQTWGRSPQNRALSPGMLTVHLHCEMGIVHVPYSIPYKYHYVFITLHMSMCTYIHIVYVYWTKSTAMGTTLEKQAVLSQTLSVLVGTAFWGISSIQRFLGWCKKQWQWYKPHRWPLLMVETDMLNCGLHGHLDSGNIYRKKTIRQTERKRSHHNEFWSEIILKILN